MKSKSAIMKKYLIIFLWFCVTVNLPAQNKVIEQLIQKYSDMDSVTSIVITKNMFQLFANVDNPTNDDFLRTVKNLDFIKILTIKGASDGKAFYRDILAAVPVKDYKELMTIKETDKQSKFLTLEKDGVIKELIMISNGKEESSLIWIAGIIDMKTVSKISKSMQIDGMENLEKVEKKE
jgi:hypothetical protein